MTPTGVLRKAAGVLCKALAWLQAGYPDGIARKDYFPLLAFLARGLKRDEMGDVVTALLVEHEPGHQTTTADVRDAIEMVTKSPALGYDIKRMESHLRGLGWELAPARDR